MTFLLRRIPGTSRSALLYGISLLISDLHHLRKHLVATQRLALRWKWAYRWLSFVRLSSPKKKKSSLMLQQGIVLIFHHSIIQVTIQLLHFTPNVLAGHTCLANAMWCMKNDNDNLKATTRFKSPRMSWKWIHSHFLSSEAQTAKSLKKSLRKLCRPDISKTKMWPRHGLD